MTDLQENTHDVHYEKYRVKRMFDSQYEANSNNNISLTHSVSSVGDRGSSYRRNGYHPRESVTSNGLSITPYGDGLESSTFMDKSVIEEKDSQIKELQKQIEMLRARQKAMEM